MAISEDQARDYPPRLYAEGASKLENKVINHNMHMGEFPNAREALGVDVWDYLRESPLGIIVKQAERKSLRVEKNEFWSLVGDEPLRFSLNEFGEITGLNTDPVPTESFEPDQYKEFWKVLKVPLGQGPKLDELRVALEVCPAWSFDQRKWLGLLLLQAMGLYAMHHNSRIPFESAKRVFDDEAMMTYPWGRTAYEVLVDSIKRLDPQGKSYFINGLTNVLLVWAYESVTCFGERFGRVVDEQEVPLFRWGGKRTRTSLDTVIAEEIREHGEVRVRKMVMKNSLEEMFPQWPDESDDTRLVNLITDIYTGRFVRGFWVTPMKRKQTKAGGSSKAEPPIKKQKKVNIIVRMKLLWRGRVLARRKLRKILGTRMYC
ncbi:uncharacterized protein LOC108845159 [Raphanus sativus]|uniref:Uncharacterized protein LOC108845159 n=1 Tax=Raphanus sativus TaxID=3726 RepID=A0A6J0MP54_RAPSA|nr:uncharacterized protein LOC108845159 [Raphanus sativus]